MSAPVVRITAMAVGAADEPLYSEMTTHLKIVDEGGWEFVEVEQSGPAAGIGKIQINPEEWPMLREAIDGLINECRGDK